MQGPGTTEEIESMVSDRELRGRPSDPADSKDQIILPGVISSIESPGHVAPKIRQQIHPRILQRKAVMVYPQDRCVGSGMELFAIERTLLAQQLRSTQRRMAESAVMSRRDEDIIASGHLTRRVWLRI